VSRRRDTAELRGWKLSTQAANAHINTSVIAIAVLPSFWGTLSGDEVDRVRQG
jgi:hypothetical protein